MTAITTSTTSPRFMDSPCMARQAAPGRTASPSPAAGRAAAARGPAAEAAEPAAGATAAEPTESAAAEPAPAAAAARSATVPRTHPGPPAAPTTTAAPPTSAGAQDRHHDHDRDQQQRQRARTERPRLGFAPSHASVRQRRLQTLGFGDETRRLDEPSEDAAGVIAVAKTRHDLAANDAAQPSVGQRAFEPVPGLEAHLAILYRDAEEEPFVMRFVADAPALEDLHGELFDSHRCHARHDDDGELHTERLFDLCEIGLDRGTAGWVERAGHIGHVAGGRDLRGIDGERSGGEHDRRGKNRR